MAGTFTFRIPGSMTARLGSSGMRSWLTDFLRCPHPLPPDPGSGYERISLTLPSEAVRQAGAFLRCSSSAALRRIAAERLGISSGVALNTSPVSAQASSWPPLITPRFGTVTLRSNPPPPGKRARSAIELLFAVLPGVLFLVGLLYAVAGKPKQN
jgi:hypothetical protein